MCETIWIDEPKTLFEQEMDALCDMYDDEDYEYWEYLDSSGREHLMAQEAHKKEAIYG